jgi:thioredoxin 1
MAPILEELRKEYAGILQVDSIDVWKNPEAAKRYDIRIIPTQIFYDATGRELFRHVGFLSKKDILAKWRELGISIEKTRN